MRDTGDAAAHIRDVVRAAAFALTTAEYALAGRIPASTALSAVAEELDTALRPLGIELRELAHLDAIGPPRRYDH